METDDPWAQYPPMMTIGQVCGALQVSHKTLYAWRQAGEGPPYTRMSERAGSSIRYPREALREYLAGRTVKAVA